MRKSRLHNYILRGINPNPIPALVAAYQARVAADSGSIDETTNNLTTLLTQLNGAVPNFTNSCKLFTAPHLGSKQAAGTGGTAGNRAANKIYNIMGASGDLVQATAASQPLLLRNTGVNYAFLPGVNGNFFSTPSNTGNSLTGNFGIQFNGTVLNNNGAVGAKTATAGSNFQFALFRASATTWTLAISANGTTLNQYTSAAFSQAFVRVSRNSITGEIKFFESTDGISWAQVGTTITGITGNLFNSTADFKVGAIASNQNVANAFLNNVQLFKDDTFTTPTQIFNPQLYNRSVSQTTIPSSTGETYTINIDTNTTGLKSMICDKGLIVGNGSSYAMQAPSFAFNNEKITHYAVYRKFNNTILSVHSAIGNNAGGANGYYLANNEGSNNTVGVGVFGTAFNGRNYTDSGLLMKISTAYADTTLGNPETDYYNNNIQATPVSQTNTGNNTSGVNTSSYNLLSNNNGASLWSNEVVFADLIFEGVHDTTTRTNVYNILKTYFNLP